jgi:hypothetical protein
MNHLNKSQIIKFIDEGVNHKLHDEISSHLKRCDECYASYASFRSSLLEITNSRMPKVPRKLIKISETELGIENHKKPFKILTFEQILRLLELFNVKKNGFRYVAIPLSIVSILVVIIFQLQIKDPKNIIAVKDDQLKTDYYFLNPEVNKLTPVSNERDSMNTVLVDMSEINIPRKMPDLSNMSKAEITDTLNELGLKFRILYSSNVSIQKPEPGHLINIKDSVNIYLPYR